MLKQRDKALSVLDRIWEKVPEVSEEESNNDIEQTIAEVRAEKKRKKVNHLADTCSTGYKPTY